jgi:hydrogenase maturation factor
VEITLVAPVAKGDNVLVHAGTALTRLETAPPRGAAA